MSIQANQTTRQAARRELFATAFADMPFWETWQDERPAPTTNDPDAVELTPNFRLITRSNRRDMASKFAKRQWKERTNANSRMDLS